MLDGLRAVCRAPGADLRRWRRGSRVVLAAAIAMGTALVVTGVGGAASATGAWSAPTLVDAAGGLTSVWCPTQKFCVAVDGSGRAVIHKRKNVWEPPNLIDAGHGGFSSVSCATTVFCIAVDGVGNEKRYAGVMWSHPVSIDPGVALDAVACPRLAFCVAVDGAGNVLTYNGTTWTHPTLIDSGHALVAVSCPTVSFCVAVDASTNVLTFNGSTWTSPLSIDSGNTLTSVSCHTTAFCAAVDNHGNALTFDGTTWTSPAAIDVGNALDSVRCPTTTFCVAVDNAGNALTFDGTTWTSPDNIDLTHALKAVSCPTTYFCVAVDGAGDALTFPPPLAITTTSLPAGTVHHAYSVTLAGTGGNAPYKWLARLPQGLAINETTGVISGTPRSSGHFLVIVRLYDQRIRITGRPPTNHRVVASFMLTIS
jgi:hypothetical protein